MRGKSNIYLIVFAVVLAIALLAGPGIAASTTLTAIPRINIKYNYNDNIYAFDSDITDAMGDDNATYMDYMAGLLLRWVDGKNTLEFSGDVSYEQYLDIGDFFDDLDVEPGDFDSINGQAGMLYRYTGRIFTFRFADKFSRSRDLQRVFGTSTDAMGYWALYTHNNATIGLNYNPTPHFRNNLSYSYDTLIFDDPDNTSLFDLSDSIEHRILYRSEYDFTAKTTGILDLQAADRNFSDVNDMEAADFRLYQTYLGLRFNLRQLTYLEMLGGFAMREIYNAPDNIDIKDTQDGIGRIALVSSQPDRYNFEAYLDRGLSLYGNNLFFIYNTAGINTRLYATPKLSFKLGASYRQANFDSESNDLDDVWVDDRVDNIILGTAAIQWDILQRGGEGTLTIEGGYNYQVRDSNIDEPDDYFVPAAFRSYDAITNSYYVQLQIKPTILFGNR